mgnify:CR=1 FL=1
MSLLLNRNHFEVFGRVVHVYAVVETAVQIALSGILRLPLHQTMILSAPYSSLQLKNVAKSSAKECLTPEHSQTFCNLVGQWSAHSQLRNSIAHNRWTRGSRENSIRPVFINVRAGKAKFGGYEDHERDWTIEEMAQSFEELAKLNERIKKFLRDSGLEQTIASMLDDNITTIDELPDED